MQRRNKVCANWNVFCWIGNRSAHNKRHACQHCHLRMKHIHMFAITRMDAERNERSRSEKTSNFFWVHTSNLRDPLRFLNAQLRGWWFAKMRGVRRVGGEIIEHRVDRSSDRFQLGEAGEDRAVTDLAVDHERRALGDFERVKFRGARASTSFDFRRARTLERARERAGCDRLAVRKAQAG